MAPLAQENGLNRWTRLELRRHVTVARRDAEQERVVFEQRIRAGDRIVRLGWAVHLFQDIR